MLWGPILEIFLVGISSLTCGRIPKEVEKFSMHLQNESPKKCTSKGVPELAEGTLGGIHEGIFVETDGRTSGQFSE